MSHTALSLAPGDAHSDFTNAVKPRCHHQVTRKHTAGKIDRGFITQVQGLLENNFLVTERRMQFSDIDLAVTQPGGRGSLLGRYRAGQIPGTEIIALDAMINTLDNGVGLA